MGNECIEVAVSVEIARARENVRPFPRFWPLLTRTISAAWIDAAPDSSIRHMDRTGVNRVFLVNIVYT